MLDLLIQLSAAFGPIALAVMGVVVSLRPPGGVKGARFWAGAFAVVGILSAAAIFNELRGTDQILGQIWDHLKETKPVAKEGARYVLNPHAINRGTKTVQISYANKGDVTAREGTRSGMQITYSDHVLTEKEEDEWYAKAKANVPPIGAGIEDLKDMGRSTILDVPATDAQYDNVIAGTGYFYVFYVKPFKDETAPGKTFLATLCTYYHGNLDAPKVCLGHNEQRLAD